MVKNLRISSYFRKPFLIYDFAPDPVWISLYTDEENFILFFISVASKERDLDVIILVAFPSI